MVTERVRSWCRGVVAAIPFCIYVCKDCSCILGPIQSIPSLGVRSVFLFVVADVVRIVPYESFHPLRHNDVAKKPPPVFKKKKKKKNPLDQGPTWYAYGYKNGCRVDQCTSCAPTDWCRVCAADSGWHGAKSGGRTGKIRIYTLHCPRSYLHLTALFRLSRT